MLTDKDVESAASALITALETGKQTTQPSVVWPDITIEDAYRISSTVADHRVRGGSRIVGHKVGLTSKAMQRSSKIDEPDYGHIFSEMVMNDGATLTHADFCIPRVEPELTFVLKDRLQGPGVSFLDVMAATEWVIPSIEVIDARVEEPRKIFDTVSDNGAGAALILGGRPVRPDTIDLRWVGAIFHRNSAIEETGLAAGVLGHPAMAVAWLANKLAEFGKALDPGHMVLSGSFTRPVWAEVGDTLHADFGPLGTVAVSFS